MICPPRENLAEKLFDNDYQFRYYKQYMDLLFVVNQFYESP